MESWRLHQQLAEVEKKRSEWREKEKETPQVRREGERKGGREDGRGGERRRGRDT